MRIWTLHPKYLDAKGLVALWRETLLAKNVLEGKTKGYRNHPQLNRFKTSGNPVDSINFYLNIIYLEAQTRKYNFDQSKFKIIDDHLSMAVNQGQLNYELNHLLSKLKVRDTERYNQVKNIKNIILHPLFIIVPGDIEEWEVV